MTIGDTIRERISTRDLCEAVGVKLDRHGNALCPFHGDTNKSLKVYKDPRRGWTCFGCHKGGSVIDFAMLWYGITFQQAVVRLDTDFALGLQLGGKRTPDERREARRKREQRRRLERGSQLWIKAAETTEKNVFLSLCEVLSQLETNRPKRGENAVSDEYAEALWKLPILRYEYECAADALNMARKEAEAIGTNSATA